MVHADRLLLAMLALLTGCACTGEQIVSRPLGTYPTAAWKARQSLGKVLVIGPAYVGAQSDKDRTIRRIVRGAFEKLPETTVIDVAIPPDASEPFAPVSDAAAIAAGKRQNAQTVGILTVGQFDAFFAVPLFPPGWETQSDVTYSIRLLDVASGNLLLSAVSHRTRGGYLAIIDPDAARRADFQSDLHWLLAGKE
jgi:hypothetical protein